MAWIKAVSNRRRVILKRTASSVKTKFGTEKVKIIEDRMNHLMSQVTEFQRYRSLLASSLFGYTADDSHLIRDS